MDRRTAAFWVAHKYYGDHKIQSIDAVLRNMIMEDARGFYRQARIVLQ